MSTNQLRFTAASTQQLLKSRALVKTTDIGQTRRFHIRGNGTLIAVTKKDGTAVLGNDGIALNKMIYNVVANSQLAMMNPANKEIFRQGMLAETTGNMDAAHELYNRYLNKVQVSFSVIINPGRKNFQGYDKQLVEGEIELITTDNGQLITITNPRAPMVEKLGKTPEYSFDELMGITKDLKPEDVFAPIDGATAPAVEGEQQPATA